jgi:hypothetical protein
LLDVGARKSVKLPSQPSEERGVMPGIFLCRALYSVQGIGREREREREGKEVVKVKC